MGSSIPSTLSAREHFQNLARSVYELTRETVNNWLDDKAPSLAAALAYYTVFSLAPLLIIALAVASFFFNSETVRGQVLHELSGLIGPSGAQTVQSMIESTTHYYNQSSGIEATVVGILFLFVGATGVFSELQDSLNKIWNVDKKKTTGLRNFLKEQVLSFAMVVGIGFLLTVSLLISAALTGVTQLFGERFIEAAWFWETINFSISFVVTAGLFSSIFKVLPNVDLSWRDVWVGGTLNSLLFVIGKTLLGFYIGHSAVSSAFGAAGSVILILVWVYYTAQILFFCAEFTKIYADRRARAVSSPRSMGSRNPPLTEPIKGR